MPYRILLSIWLSDAISVILSSAVSVAISLEVFVSHKTAFGLSLLIASRYFASIFFSPVAGWIADRYDRKKIIIICNAILAILSLCMLEAVHISHTNIGIAGIALLNFISGIMNSILTVTLGATVRDIASKEQLVRANALVTVIQNAPLFLGPPLGAAIYVVWGITPVLLCDAVSFLFTAVIILFTHWDRPTIENPRELQGPFKGARYGFTVIFRHSAMRHAQIAYACSNFGTGIGVGVLSAYILDITHCSPIILSANTVAASLGVILASMIILGKDLPFLKTTIINVSLLCAVLLGRLPILIWSLPAVIIGAAFLRSFFQESNNAPLLAIWQQAITKTEQGRVFGARRLLAQGPYPFAVLLGGYIADILHKYQGISLHKSIWCTLLISVIVELITSLYLIATPHLKHLENIE